MKNSIYPYGATAHHVARLLKDEKFPITEEALRKKYGSVLIYVEEEKTVAFSYLLARMGLAEYETSASFFSALNSIL